MPRRHPQLAVPLTDSNPLKPRDPLALSVEVRVHVGVKRHLRLAVPHQVGHRSGIGDARRMRAEGMARAYKRTVFGIPAASKIDGT